MKDILNSNQTALEIQNLSKIFGEIKAVNGISLTIYTGEVFGLLGPNGSGKTTTIRMICGLLKPSTGKIQLFHHEIHEEAIYRSIIGYLPQQDAIYDDLTIYENMRYFGAIYGVDSANLEKRIKDYSVKMGLSKRMDHLVKTLSGGYKRRVAIVCALLHDPSFIILDEPTLGLDPIIRVELWNFFKELKDNSKTILVTTHYMEEANNCDRVAIMKEGVIMATGNPDELKVSLFKDTAVRFEEVYLALTKA